ncbi:pirin family protein [Sphingosinicella terrae]|uniref:pirin family protein n=1 Tax=Sphingosinicella terrae TaxID=2172047 RepID=UPI000E0DC922|nr:pirin family protein [Sphingosinicella terrae]
MIRFRDRGARGRHAGGMIDSFHTFSFGDYVDPRQMGFRSLRVLNEDRLVPSAGFPAHDHRDMEILTYVLEGELEHRDSLGNVARIRAGDVQLMTAGTGITHSEMNAGTESRAHFLQIWIIPDRLGLPSAYRQQSFPPRAQRNRWIAIAAPDGGDGVLALHQDACVFLARLDEGRRLRRDIAAGRGLWLQVVRGLVALDGTEMREGDGAAVEAQPAVEIIADTEVELLLLDLA